jgi:hypothetical protein
MMLDELTGRLIGRFERDTVSGIYKAYELTGKTTLYNYQAEAPRLNLPTIESVIALGAKFQAMEPIPPPIRIYRRPFSTLTVHARKHRKTRVNKKWRKRFGFKQIPDDKQNETVAVLNREGVAYCGYTAYDQLIARLKVGETKSGEPILMDGALAMGGHAGNERQRT